MSFFTSDRERHLGLWRLAVVVAIYSTLAGARPQGLSAVAFIAGMLMVGLTVLTQGLKVRPCGAEIAVALGVATVYLLV